VKLAFLHRTELNSSQRLIRLRLYTLFFFCLLLIPISSAFYLLYCQFEKEQLTTLQHQTDKVTAAINKRLLKRSLMANGMVAEEFDYYVRKFNSETKEMTKALSPLSEPKLYKKHPGLLGYFQIDQDDNFNSPVCPTVIPKKLPANFLTERISTELLERRKLTMTLWQIVQQSDELTRLLENKDEPASTRFNVVFDVPNYFIFHRIAVVNGEKKVQGFIVTRDDYINTYIADFLSLIQFEVEILAELLSPNGEVLIQYGMDENGEVSEVSSYSSTNKETRKVLLNTSKLNWPYTDYRLEYKSSELKLTSEAMVSMWMMLFTVLVVGLGCFGFYVFGVKQLKLAEQRLNFVSSVSHELKTPLTSIRMYAEMLSAGQILSKEHQAEYFQFITSESERLTRLIENILQLAKLNQPKQIVQPEFHSLDKILDVIKSKLSSILIKHEFMINFDLQLAQPEQVNVFVDVDALLQVMINITDNTVKFFDKTEIQDKDRQKIDFVFSVEQNMLKLTIRDYGSGVSAEQENKLFELFYRGGSELTRTTQGTGIGLALVKELMLAQEGIIMAQRMSPGLALHLYFKYR